MGMVTYSRAKRLTAFWAKVEKTRTCWIWKASRSVGYGQFNWQGRVTKTHRVAWQITRGKIPRGICVLHRCDNRLCVRPGHLFLGTKRDNTLDALRKGRMKFFHGERAGNARLTDAIVREMRQLWRDEGLTLRAIAQRYKVGHATTYNAVTGLSWAHVSDDRAP